MATGLQIRRDEFMLALQSGSVFGGRYIVQRSIGSGGMGAVYLATDPRYNDFPVALKVLYPGFIKTVEARERFKTEIIASYRITHRNVVRAYEYFDSNETQAYAMEFVDGNDLQVLFKGGAAAIDQALSILRQSAAGLIAIHKRGIIHRDLKPENILVGKNGVVKIADFGVAHMRGDNTGVTQIGAMVGTPKYFAPEYIESGEMDQRGDIYALGVIGFELISGVSPFRSNSQISLMVERVKMQQIDLRSIAPNCPPDLARIIEKAMRIGVADRYQTAAEVRTDLECVENGRALLHWTPSLAPVALVEPQINSSDSPAEFIVEQQAGVSAPKSNSLPTLNFWSVLCISFLLVVLVSVGGYQFLRRVPPDLINTLGDGRFEGYIQGFSDNSVEYRLVIIKQADNLEISLDNRPCTVDKSGNQQNFTCQNDSYLLKVDLANGISAMGRLQINSETRQAWWGVRKISES